MATPPQPGTPTSNVCQECKEQIKTNQFIRVGKYCFHQDHFICAECKKDLRNEKFHRKEDEQKFYCAKDYMDKFSNSCQHCHEKIAPSTSFLQVLGGYYHPEHFVCVTCEKPFKGGKYFPKDNRPYCEEHFYLLNAKKCAHCDLPVIEKEGKVSIGGKLYHGKCVFCSHCHTPLGSGEMLRKDDKIYCREHFNDFVCRVCTGCGKHIYDQCIAVNSEFYHPDCLRCSVPTCLKKMERYTCVSGYLRCPEHEEEECLTIQCSICQKNIYGEVIRACGMRVHETCFKCGYCDTKLEKLTCKLKKDRLCCEKCIYNKEFIPYVPKRDETPADFVPDEGVPVTETKQNGTDVLAEDGEGLDDDLVDGDGLDDELDDGEDIFTEEKDKKKKPGEAKDEPIQWRKGGLIGVGAFGKVYEAMNSKTGELIAVKQVTLEEDTNSEAAGELQNEIMLMRKLRHRNIVQLLGTERVGSTLNILMEYVPGKSLDSILTRYGALAEDVTCNYTKQILLALQYCHSKRVVHRDIKGKNILVDQTGCLKLADFGSAKAFHNRESKQSPGRTYNYTPLWTAPEVLLGDYDTKVDIWSLGCVIIEMTTAKPPWSEQNFENPFRALYHIGNSGAIPKLPETLSETGLEFLLLCLQREPEKRASASDLLKHKWLEGVKL